MITSVLGKVSKFKSGITWDAFSKFKVLYIVVINMAKYIILHSHWFKSFKVPFSSVLFFHINIMYITTLGLKPLHLGGGSFASDLPWIQHLMRLDIRVG